MSGDTFASVAPAPHISDPLPTYTRRDPETLSIRSSAPSYVSEVPSYHSSIPNTIQRSTTLPHAGLRPPTYAPGFNRVHSDSVGDLSKHCFNINQWSPATNGPRARHYENVAARRATLACVEEEARLNALARNMVTAVKCSNLDVHPGDIGPSPQPADDGPGETEDSVPLSPHEDPDLVGLEAATLARERRLYIERCENGTEALRQESLTWDFMLSQMADWKERERSWDKFRAQVGKTKLLRRRLGR